MSGEKYPTLSLTMPVFIELFAYLEAEVENTKDGQLNNALCAAHACLAKYYTFTDDSPFYLLAVLLDPRFKKSFLESKDFDVLYPGLITGTVSLLKKLVSTKNQTTGQANNKIHLHASQQHVNKALLSSMFSHSTSKDDVCLDEVDKYLRLPCEDPTQDPLQYWGIHEKQFPGLSAIARDILSIPGSSVSVERVFNCGRDIIGLRRHSLKPKTLSALMFGKSALKQ
uniref:HAT C-terminal dimerisation domain-containing protein n=1 Tax=Spongospora subterranea TaxID=70186 RepID=A0A0H5R2T0_9EUKA|eukprot:CRZ08256.1 hypothetical protein [Spongospora subterranea]